MGLNEKNIIATLGEHTGLLKGIHEQLRIQGEKIDRLDERLRLVEQRSVRNGLVSGAIISGIINVGIRLFYSLRP